MRFFVIEGREFPDPDPLKPVEAIRQYMINYFPMVANAETIQTKRDGNDIIEFRKRVGEKGDFLFLDIEPCKVGYCKKTRIEYSYNTWQLRDQLRNGICPICDNPTGKKVCWP